MYSVHPRPKKFQIYLHIFVIVFLFKIAVEGGEPHRFVIHGIFLAIVIAFGIVSNFISIFIFTRPEMRTPLNLILTGKGLRFSERFLQFTTHSGCVRISNPWVPREFFFNMSSQ